MSPCKFSRLGAGPEVASALRRLGRVRPIFDRYHWQVHFAFQVILEYLDVWEIEEEWVSPLWMSSGES